MTIQTVHEFLNLSKKLQTLVAKCNAAKLIVGGVRFDGIRDKAIFYTG